MRQSEFLLMKTTVILRSARLTFLFLILGLPSAWAQRDFGVDISHFQAASGVSTSSWGQMFLDGKRFAFIKATEGLTGPDDAPMATNMIRAVNAGLRAGVYHYAHPENRPTTNGAVQEADHLLSYAGNFVGPGYLRPVLDVEGSAATLSTSNLTDWVIAFRNEIVAQRGPGAAPIIYCSQFFTTNELDSRMAGFDLWVRVVGSGANPTNDPLPGLPPATGVFTNWSFWQYDAAGSSGGINPLDLNVCQSEFRPLDFYLIPTIPSPQLASVVTDPQSQSVTVGSSASFSVAIAVSSTPPVGYQWLFRGTNIAGATLATYTRTNAQLADAFGYSVIVTNPAGSITSAVANLTVLTPVALYAQDFDSYASPSIITAPTTSDGFKIYYQAISNGVDFTAQFGFDYSTVTFPTNIPPAPHTTNGTTKGLYLTVNKDGFLGTAAVNLYPTGQVFSGNFSLRFDLWINWTNLATSTEHTLFGINHSGDITNRVGQTNSDGLFFAMNGDGGSSPSSVTLRDYSVFQGGGTNAIPFLKTNNFITLLGSQFDSANPGIAALFPAKSVPGYAPTPAGSAGLGWVSCEVRQETNLITWLLNDVIVAQYSNSTIYTNGNIMIGYNDAFASIGNANNFVIFDNLRVETVNPDLDGDGLPDAWETQYFGNVNGTATSDADGDGASSLQEYLAGTNPTNSLSSFRLLSATKTGDDMRLDWTTVGGHSYVLQFLTNATASLTGTFADLSPVIPVTGFSEGATNYVHLGGATNKGSYYRVRLGP